LRGLNIIIIIVSNLDGLSNLTSVESPWIDIIGNTFLSNFCGLNELIINGGYNGNLTTYDNAYNPSKQDIIDGNCSL